MAIFSTRWITRGAVLLALCSAVTATAVANDGIAYLEGLKGRPQPYLAPSDIDPRFTLALYVNVATSGSNKQRMWVLERDSGEAPWRLGLVDQAYWKRKAKKGPALEPAYSWPVSSGRHYRGDRRSGPTPPGIYGIDERKGRYGYGWMQDGMINVLHIDYHYSDGRASGIAFHGTTVGRYGRLGTNDSHGCIRMHQGNARALLDRLTGRDKALTEAQRWGEVPRFWLTESGRKRRGYVRDGSVLTALPATAEAEPVSPSPDDGSLVQVATDAGTATPVASEVLTKSGFRALAIVFMD